MKMITIQKEFIKDNILYPVNLLSKNQQQSPNCYKRLFEDFYNKTNIKINKAIWCYSQLFKDEEICLNDKHINRAFEMGTINNPYAYLLNVPNDFCLQTSFYDWVDQIFKEEFPNDEPNYNPKWDNIYYLENINEIQCIIPFIKKEWILDIKILKN